MIVAHVKTWIAVALVAAGPIGLSAFDYRTIQGEITAPACSAAEVAEVPGESAAARLMRCARQGVPLALATADALYAITGDYTANRNAKLLDFVAKPVEAKGQVTEREGLLSINVAAMMVRK